MIHFKHISDLNVTCFYFFIQSNIGVHMSDAIYSILSRTAAVAFNFNEKQIEGKMSIITAINWCVHAVNKYLMWMWMEHMLTLLHNHMYVRPSMGFIRTNIWIAFNVVLWCKLNVKKNELKLKLKMEKKQSCEYTHRVRKYIHFVSNNESCFNNVKMFI